MLKRCVCWIDRILKILVTAVLSILVFLIFVNIITRNIFSFSILWVEEVSRHLFVWGIFLGISYSVLNSSLMSISFLTDIMERKNLELLCHVIYWIASLCFWGIVAYCGVQYTIVGHQATSSMLGIRLSMVYAAIPYCGFASIIFIIMNIILYFQERKPTKTLEGGRG